MVSLSCEAEHPQAQETIHAALAKSDSLYSHWPKKWGSNHCLWQEQSHPGWICLTWKANPDYTVSLAIWKIPACKYSYMSQILKYQKIKTVRIFFNLFGYFDTQECCPRQVPHNHRAQCDLSGLCLHGQKGLCKKILYKKCLCLWHHFPSLTKQHSSYLCPVIQGRNPLLWWWDILMGKMSGYNNSEALWCSSWAIITTLSRKVDQLTEKHAWGIIVEKNTLLLMTFYRNFYSEGISNTLNAGQREHCR